MFATSITCRDHRVRLATGHSVWGILNAPGTGEALQPFPFRLNRNGGFSLLF
jgi:hypothetical protein